MIEVTGPPLDLNYQDATASMNTALHMAAANGHSEVVKLLLKHAERVKLDLQNETGNTPLHYAALNGKKEAVEMLVEAKASAKINNNFGRSALEDALQAGHGDIAEVLAPISDLDEEKIYSQYDPKKEDELTEGMFPVEEVNENEGEAEE